MISARLITAALVLAVVLPARGAALPPDPAITSGPVSPTNMTDAAFAFTGSGEGATMLCSLDDPVEFGACDSSTAQYYAGPLAPGPHVFRLKATDGTDTTGTVSFAWTIDLTAPRITLLGVPNPSGTASATFTFFADEALSFACQIDGQAVEVCPPDPNDPTNPAKGAKTYTGLGEGSHAFSVTATDGAGNVTSAEFRWTIDLTAPALAITTVPLDPTPSNAASFSFESAEPATFDCQLDGAAPGALEQCDAEPNDPAKGAKSYTGLADGSYTFTVTATDRAGNASTQTFSWLIDSDVPGVAFDPPSPAPNGDGWNNTDVVISFAIQDAAAGVDVAASTASPLVLSTEGGAVTATVTARDKAGNTASIPSPAVNIDKTPPAVTITAPAEGAVFGLGQSVAAIYSCTDTLSGAAACAGPVPSGTNIDTTSLGAMSFAVSAADRAGNSATRTAHYTVIPAIPDLVGTAVSNPPSLALPGSSFAVTDTVANQGGATAGASTSRYYLSLDTVKDGSDILLTGSRVVPVLAMGASSGASVTLTIPSTTPLRKYYLLACADDTAAVAEIDESNNCRASTTTVQVTRPDLIETAVSYAPAAAAPGSTVKVLDTVRNQGLLPAAASVTRYYLSTDSQKSGGDTLLSKTRSVPALQSGGESGDKSVAVTIPSEMPLGTYYLLACADDTALVPEAEENNNCVASPVPLQVTRPDLVETAVSNPPTAATPGSSFKLTDTAQNQGLVAAPASKTRYYLSSDTRKDSGDTLLTGSRSVPGLAPGDASAGATVTVTMPTTIALGTYYLLACADDTATVAESDEQNNCIASATQIQVTRPDLVETAVSNPPAAARRGTTIKASDTVRNQGLVSAAATTTRYYLSTDQRKGSGDTLLTGSRSVPGLGAGDSSAGATVTLTIPSTTPPSTYYLLACADDTALVPETDETHNCIASNSQLLVTP